MCLEACLTETACLSLEEDAYMLIMIFYLHNLRQCACLSLEDCLVWKWLQGGEKGSKIYEICTVFMHGLSWEPFSLGSEAQYKR